MNTMTKPFNDDEVKSVLVRTFEICQRQGFHVTRCDVYGDQIFQHLYAQWLLHLPPQEVFQDLIKGRDRLVETADILRNLDLPLEVLPVQAPNSDQNGRMTSFVITDAPFTCHMRLIQVNSAADNAMLN